MKKLVCALRDDVAELYMAPVFVPTLATLYRDLREAARPGQDNPIAKHPGDFTVYQLGTYDDESGRLDVLSSPHRLASCAVFVDAVGADAVGGSGGAVVGSGLVPDAEGRN